MANPIDLHVGKQLSIRRVSLGMTQGQLAEQVGVRFQQIQKYEVGHNRISASRMWDIAAVLQVPVTYFFEGLSSSVPETGESWRGICAEKEALKLIRAYSRIPEPHRKKVMDLVCVLSDAA